MPVIGREKITITGGSGFVGRILRSGLQSRGYEIEVFDPMRGLLVDWLRCRYLGTSTLRLSRFLAPKIHHAQSGIERTLIQSHLISPTSDDILDIPNHTTGNECAISTEKARSILGYNPKPGGTYFSFDVMW